MDREKRGIIFADEDLCFQMPNLRKQINNLDRLLKNEISASRNVVCCISELDRKDYNKVKSKKALITLNEVSKIKRNSFNKVYDNLIEGMQIELDSHAEMLEMNLEKCKLEVEEKIKKENIEFEMFMKHSEIMNSIFIEEKKHLDFMQSLIDEYINDSQVLYKDRKEFQLFADTKNKILEILSSISFV